MVIIEDSDKSRRQSKGVNMEIQLEELIEKIKKDGLDAAAKQGQEVIAQAKKQADEIVAKAKEKASSIEQQAKDAATRLRQNTEQSLRQSARDSVLIVKEQLIKIGEQLLRQEVAHALDQSFVQQLVVKLIEHWLAKGVDGVEIFVSQRDKVKLEQLIASRFSQAAKRGITIQTTLALDAGFRIGIKNDAAYYDFSEESIFEMLKKFLSPAISRMLDNQTEAK